MHLCHVMAHIEVAKTVTFPRATFAPCFDEIPHAKLGCACPAGAVMLNHRTRDLKSIGFAITMIMGMALFDIVAIFTNEEFGEVRTVIMVASNKGIKGLNAVNKAVTREKVKGAVNCGGLCLLYTSPSPRDKRQSRMPSSA